MVDAIKTPEEKLSDIRDFLESGVKEGKQILEKNGTSHVSFYEDALQLSQLARGESGEVDGKLLQWYNEHDGEAYEALFMLIGSYLFSAGLISEEKQKPVYEIPEDASVEEIIVYFRKWLTDPEKGSPEDRAMWQQMVDKVDKDDSVS